MIRALILYYLNVKPTHGYEIQKYLQVSGADKWTKIQSGSIYYALAKLEKENCVEVLREEKTGARIRKIYGITELGKKELQQDIQGEMQKLIMPVGSDKFLLHNILDALPKETLQNSLEKHLKYLKEQKAYWEKWEAAKEIQTNKGLYIEKIEFDMTINSLDYQISWHEEILSNMDKYISVGNETRRVIKSIDFSDVEEDFSETSERTNALLEIQKLRNEIISNPDKAVENIDKIISKLQNK